MSSKQLKYAGVTVHLNSLGAQGDGLWESLVLCVHTYNLLLVGFVGSVWVFLTSTVT